MVPSLLVRPGANGEGRMEFGQARVSGDVLATFCHCRVWRLRPFFRRLKVRWLRSSAGRKS